MIWTLLPGAVFLADGCLKKKAEEELKENEQIPVCKGHIVLRKCHNRGVAGGGFADSTKKVEILTFFLLSGLWARLGALAGRRKCKAEEELKENEQIPVCKGHIVLRKCHNRGVAGGGFADSTKKVEILTFFLLSGLWARLGALAGRRKCKAKKLGLALTIGGGMSNWYDRHKRGYVTDYVSFRFGPEKFRRLVFNVSDFCIFFGLALLTAISCRESR